MVIILELLEADSSDLFSIDQGLGATPAEKGKHLPELISWQEFPF